MCSYQAIPTIQTPRLNLRPLAAEDASWIAAHAGDFDVAKMTTRMPYPYALEDAKTFIDGLNDPLSVDEAVFGIDAKDEGLVGVLGFHNSHNRGQPEMGYWLGKPWWGKGYATEAASGALKWARSGWGRKVVFAGHFTDNPASGAVLIKSGFLYTGQVEPHLSKARGEETDMRWMVWLA